LTKKYIRKSTDSDCNEIFQYISDRIMAEGGDRTSTASSNNDVNEQFLASLLEMGIPQEAARQVLH